MVGYIKKYNPYCCLCFEWHTVRCAQSLRGGLLFNSKGYCKFASCTMTFTFKIKDEDLLAELVFSGRMVRHDTAEEHARPVRGKKRIEWAEAMQDVAPREEHLKRLDRMPEDVYQSGNRDMAPSTAVLRKIASERNISKRRDDDEMKSLDILKKEQEQLGENAVLRVVTQNPAGVMLWSKACIRIFHRRCLEDVVYLDATGGVIKNRDAPFYAYEIVVRNALKGRSPFAVATFVTCCHSTSSVTNFLQEFKRDYGKLYGWATSARPKLIMSDGSVVLMNAIATAFCDASLELIMKRFFRIISGRALPSDFKYPVMHRCLSHIMKNAKMMCKKRLEALRNYKNYDF